MIRATSRVRTGRLAAHGPYIQDVPEFFAIPNDPRIWQHIPNVRPLAPTHTLATVEMWIAGWALNGLDTWVARLHDRSTVLGYGGCSLLHDQVWNLGYRFAADDHGHGHGYPTEVATAAIGQAHAQRPELPVIAYLLEHNTASANVAQRIGLTLAHRGRGRGNPDPHAVRLVYSDRPPAPRQLQLQATLR